MPDYEVRQDDHRRLETVHDSVPELMNVVEVSEVYDELNQGIDDREPMEWTDEEYDVEELERVGESLESLEEADLDFWKLEVDSYVGEDVTDVVPETRVTAALTYDFEAKGYGATETDVEVTFSYDERDATTAYEIRMGENTSEERNERGMDFDLPEHFSEEDEEMLEQDFMQDVERATFEIRGAVEDAL